MRAVFACLFFVCGCSSSGPSPAAQEDAAADAVYDASADAVVEAAPADAGCGPSTVSLTTVGPGITPELKLEGDVGSTMGVFDPAIVWPAGAKTGVMSYSSVPRQDAIRTRVATSTDGGATWSFAAEVNAPKDVTAPTTEAGLCPGTMCTGRIVHEVSTIAIDPSDTARPYKVFTHSYFLFTGDDPKLRYDWGYIGLYTAADPAGPWSEATKVLGWKSSMPSVSQDGVGQVLTDEGALKDCIAFTEPSVIATEGTLELALGCATAKSRIRIVQLRSTDHGAHFTYVGTLLSDDDASCLGSTQLNAAHLFAVGAKVYLLASTAGTVAGGFSGYDGCSVFEIEDLATAKVKHEGPSPKVLRRIHGSDNRFAGACTYAEGATALGYVASSLVLEDAPRVFRMFSTGASAP